MWRLKQRGYPVEQMTMAQISFVNHLEREMHGEQMLTDAMNVLNGVNLAFSTDRGAFEKLKRHLIGV